MSEEKIQQQRKPRKDKGRVMFSPRDAYCLEWIADQYAARWDQVQQLLSRFPGGELKNQRAGLAATTVKDQISRWERAGWIEYQRVLVDQPGWMWITRKGLQAVHRDEIYAYRAPAHTRLNHIYAVNQVRLAADREKDLTWKSEREYRSELEGAGKGESIGPIPDALILTEKGGRIAVEVELTIKKPLDLEEKLEALVSAYESDKPKEKAGGLTSLSGGNARYRFTRVWFYVPDEKARAAVERARANLIEADQKRIEVVAFAGLVP